MLMPQTNPVFYLYINSFFSVWCTNKNVFNKLTETLYPGTKQTVAKFKGLPVS